MWLQDLVYNALNRLIKTRFYTALMTLAHGDLEYRIMRINQFNLSTAKMHKLEVIMANNEPFHFSIKSRI